MNRHGPSHPDPNSAIEQQPLEHPFDVFVAWGFEGLISKVEGFVNQFSADVFVHEAILEAGCARRNSQLSFDFFVHVATVGQDSQENIIIFQG